LICQNQLRWILAPKRSSRLDLSKSNFVEKHWTCIDELHLLRRLRLKLDFSLLSKKYKCSFTTKGYPPTVGNVQWSHCRQWPSTRCWRARGFLLPDWSEYSLQRRNFLILLQKEKLLCHVFFLKMKPKNLCCEIWRPRRLLPLLQAGLTRAYPCPMEPTFQRQG